MNRVFLSSYICLILMLAGCGNKGDLYLEPEDLTEAQKALLNKLEGKDDKSQSELKKKAKEMESINTPEKAQ